MAAQQRLRASYSTGTSTIIRTDVDDEQDVRGYDVGLGGTSLTLSVYF